MSIVITQCSHKITEIEGEQVCKNCGMVVGYSETESGSDWKSHNPGLFGMADLYYLVSKVAKNLHLPSYAIQTIIQTSSKLRKMKITKKQAILFAIVYSCRIHNIPRLLEDIFYELEKSSGKKIRYSENSLLKLLNKISSKVTDSDLVISPPNKEYYLQAYLAKIQETLSKDVDEQYFEIIRVRALKQIKEMHSDPSTAAKEAILQNTSRILRTKLRDVLT